MSNYKITKVYRDLGEEDLSCTATETALIIDYAEFGLVALIPTKDKEYRIMDLSREALEKAHPGMVIDLNKARILIVATIVKNDTTGEEVVVDEEPLLDF